jgi:glycosyltransferase involved in cell wall biosynthesis
MASTHPILVVIPAYCEEESLGTTLEELLSVPDRRWDVVVVDDSSSDGTVEVARRHHVEVLCLAHNLGIGGAVQTGFRYAARAGYPVTVQLDADGQHPADAIDSLAEPILRGEADVVIGSRFLEAGGFKSTASRRAGILVLSRLVSWIVRSRITDPTSGFRAFGTEATRLLAREYPVDYPEPEAVVLLSKHGFRLLEIPVHMRTRRGGASSIAGWKSLYYMVKVILALLVASAQKRIPFHGREV